jgi:hypothetical protein
MYAVLGIDLVSSFVQVACDTLLMFPNKNQLRELICTTNVGFVPGSVTR